MRTSTLAASFLALVAGVGLLFGGSALGGQDKAKNAFKGKWEVTLSTPFGEIPVVVSITPNGKGVLWLDQGSRLPVVHQETETWISWTIELPAVQAPDANAHTIIGRGDLQEDGSMTGNLVIVTAKADAESPVGYETHVGTFAATKRGK